MFNEILLYKVRRSFDVFRLHVFKKNIIMENLNFYEYIWHQYKIVYYLKR